MEEIDRCVNFEILEENSVKKNDFQEFFKIRLSDHSIYNFLYPYVVKKTMKLLFLKYFHSSIYFLIKWEALCFLSS